MLTMDVDILGHHSLGYLVPGHYIQITLGTHPIKTTNQNEDGNNHAPTAQIFAHPNLFKYRCFLHFIKKLQWRPTQTTSNQ